MRGVLSFLISLLPLLTYGQQDVTVIHFGTLIDTRQGKNIGPGSIRIEGDRIAEVGPTVRIPDNARIIDLSGATVLPGMLDLHCHFLDDPETRTRGSGADRALIGVRNAEKILLSGFTTIRDPGGGSPNYASVSVRDAVERGWFPGPRIVVACRFLSITGGHGDNNFIAPEHDIRGDNIVNGVEEMRAAVRQDVKFGADWIKLYATGGFFSAGDDPGQQHFSDEEMEVAVEEAARLGRFVSAHAHGAQGIKAAVKAGVRTIEHGTWIDNEGIGLMKTRGTYLVPTLRTIEVLAEDPGMDASAGRMKAYELSRNHFTTMMVNIGKAMKAGVKTCLGSDMVTLHMGSRRRNCGSTSRPASLRWKLSALPRLFQRKH
ncbi:MAG: amidohydrolase family protein [Ignavibacteria bacterium]|nr:amidohydrolase family protein [Ignavibacteria bacterium]